MGTALMDMALMGMARGVRTQDALKALQARQVGA
eukprot:CAMPEP_0171661374 /NCGR_PEP_ID=MMETSP0990-20121206/44896_1 /TAXON_ID=483369 /ORGANISM="non described non described, Strain CCMP2098" /LENGTH=33 /DNA_ID= /DNA_START= /DNA_END= /DNA_ORIENTATION=